MNSKKKLGFALAGVAGVVAITVTYLFIAQNKRDAAIRVKVESNENAVVDLDRKMKLGEDQLDDPSGTEAELSQYGFRLGEVANEGFALRSGQRFFITDTDEIYFANIDDARNGSVKAMMDVYAVAKSCQKHFGRDSRYKGINPELSGINQKFVNATEGCEKIYQEYLDSDLSTNQEYAFFIEGKNLLRRAAAEGHALAQLSYDFPVSDLSEERYTKVASHLERAVIDATVESFVFAADFYLMFHHEDGNDINEVEAIKWEYLGCVRFELCDPQAFLHNSIPFRTDSELAEIEAFPARYAQHVTEGTPFGFASSWLPYHSYSTILRSGDDVSQGFGFHEETVGKERF